MSSAQIVVGEFVPTRPLVPLEVVKAEMARDRENYEKYVAKLEAKKAQQGFLNYNDQEDLRFLQKALKLHKDFYAALNLKGNYVRENSNN